MARETLLITQARMTSTRLPGKILKQVGGRHLLGIHLERLKRARHVDKIIVATTENKEDDLTAELVASWGYEVFRGSESDVLGRFYTAASPYSPGWIVRVTADCPLIDPAIVDSVIQHTQASNADYGSNTLVEHYPDGQDVEVFTFKALKIAYEKANKPSDREHVTPYIRNNSTEKGGTMFRSVNFPSSHDYSHIRMTVDEPADFTLLCQLIEKLGIEKSWIDYTQYIMEHGLMKINGDITRNEGFIESLKKDNL